MDPLIFHSSSEKPMAHWGIAGGTLKVSMRDLGEVELAQRLHPESVQNMVKLPKKM